MHIFGDSLTSKRHPVGVMSGFIFSTYQSSLSLHNLEVLKLSTHRQLLSDGRYI